MKKKVKTSMILSVAFFIAFILWTILVRAVDLAPIGPEGSVVGFSMINGFFRDLVGTNMQLYIITDWLSIIPILAVFCFAVLGLIQWIKRRSIKKVDVSILLLGLFYISVMIVYLIFEFVTINHRPVLIDGILETSYPSSTTMLVLCVMPTAGMQLWGRIRSKKFRILATSIISVFTLFMLIGRIISGVHWITDIIGGILISISLVALYFSLTGMQERLDKVTKQ